MKLWNYSFLAIICIGVILIALSFASNEVRELPANKSVNIDSEEQFVIEMISNHQEAVNTANVIGSVTENQKIHAIADKIVEQQSSEINKMNEWKNKWFANSTYSPLYTNNMPNIDGKNVDELFIQDMIMNHEIAINMSKQVLAINPRKEIKYFAENIIKVQSKEITAMKEMLG